MDPVTISDDAFHQLIVKRSPTLLALASHISEHKSGTEILIRPLLGELLSQSMQIEEVLDAYDARNNCDWCSFRALTAALKLFSDVSYELLHIQHALPAYRLLSIEHDFSKATEQALAFTGDVILRTTRQMLVNARQLNIPIPENNSQKSAYSEHLPPGRLRRHCVSRRGETVSETVTLLTTAFLNLAADSKQIHTAERIPAEQYASYVTGSISEEGLRGLQLRFHNLQSMYDTYVSETEAEGLDKDLPVLRGHISVVFHLLKTATGFAHYYERHMKSKRCDLPPRLVPLISCEELLAILINYSLSYISLYIGCAERLCRTMLKRYAEVGTIEVPVPRYRGFHVRPSTLVSKLVLHYGSEVRMELDSESYDAGSPLELFRANEKINAQKRRWLASEILRLKLIPQNGGGTEIKDIVRSAILMLVEQNKLVVYEHPLQFSEGLTGNEGTLFEQVIDEMARLQATGKIDINVDINISFTGDKRVLADIKLLAESGYGEDKFGNNISLPEKLTYLKQ